MVADLMTVVRLAVGSRQGAAGALALALLAGGAACGGGAVEPEPLPPQAACSTPADCADGNACTAETCTAGACGGSYTPEMAAVLLGAGLSGTSASTFTVVATSGSVIPRTTHTFCPDGPVPALVPPACVGALDLPSATGVVFTPTPGGGTLEAVVPVRFPNLVTVVAQTAGTIGGGAIAIVGNGACPGQAQTHASLPVRVEFAIGSDGELGVTASVDAVPLANATVGCITGNVASQVAGLIEEAGRALIRVRLLEALERAVEAQLCARAPCPAGYAEDGGLCRRGGAASAPCLARPRDPKTGLLEPLACLP